MKIKQPDWEDIVMLCQEKIRERYIEYGNSWTEENSKDSIKFWKDNLERELKKTIESLNLQEHREILSNATDLMNVCAMIMTLEMKKLG